MKDSAKLLISVIGCELVGILGSWFTVSAIPTWYATLDKPAFTPPNSIFAPVWTLLYLLMGISFYLIWRQGWNKKKVRTASIYFLIQLWLNLLWSPVFFGQKSPGLALVIILAMWAMVAKTMQKFSSLSQLAAYLLVPYLLWISFASVLNTSFVVLN
jgi:tryptophan-rich sensory protein